MTATFMNAFYEAFAHATKKRGVVPRGFCTCLKEAWGCTPPLMEYIAIVQLASVQIWELCSWEGK